MTKNSNLLLENYHKLQFAEGKVTKDFNLLLKSDQKFQLLQEK